MNFKISSIFVLVAAAIVWLASGSCKKEKQLSTGGVITFSEDTLKFDTVFTAAGSYTSFMKIYNPQGQDITLSSVMLKAGGASYFHLNVDGKQGNSVTDIKIAAHDSVYLFATVNIDPTDTLTPFLITDELLVTLNGKQFSMPFTAYGQNAHYIVRDSIGVNTTWLTDKPYIVIHSLVVGQQAVLNIPANCRVYMHQDARIFVFGGLKINENGVPGKDSVVIQGDRLDRRYFEYVQYPGEWGGIYFVSGSAGIINNTMLKNCGGGSAYRDFNAQGAAIQVDSLAYLKLTNSTIKNSIGYGILSFHGIIDATNCQISATGAYALALLQGGTDSFTNCTFANYGGTGLSHSTTGTVAILNYYSPDGVHYTYGDLNATMRNCIVYGTLDSEMVCDAVPNAAANLVLDHCLLKMGTLIESFVHTSGCLMSQTPEFKYDPQFVNTSIGDYHLKSGSPAINAGTPATNAGSKDRNGDNRVVDGIIDIGCYEYKP